MTKPKKKIPDIARLLLAVTLALVVPGVWLAAIPADDTGYQAETRTRANLEQAKLHLDKFRGEFKRLPTTLTELRTYAKSRGENISSYDAYGQRLQYVKLDAEHFVLRSFGNDSVQNTIFTATDPKVAAWNKIDDTLQYDFQKRLQRLTYPAPLLMGADAPNKQWQAQLYVDPAAGQSRLMVRHRQREDLIMLAVHEQVEEFLWLPDSHRLVYTATGSSRYRDGVYLWDLLEDSTANLLDNITSKVGITALADTTQLWLSLAGVTALGPQVFFYAAGINSKELNPSAFYHPDNYYVAIIPPEKTNSAKIGRAKLMPPLITKIPWTDLNEQIIAPTTLHNLQTQWLQLPLSGGTENVIRAWQEFIQTHPQTALSPYALWMLTSLFSDSYALLRQDKKQQTEAETLRAFGAEIASALCNHPLSPAYLHGFGQFAYQQLTAKTPLPYAISKLHMR